MTRGYETIIGLEIHVQLKTRAKMFCSCSNAGENEPQNTTVCPVCMGHPGTLPVPNQQAIDWAVMTAAALGCTVADRTKFDRKSYFYPDLPKGYQISQFDKPIGEHGVLEVAVDGKQCRIGITRLHLEEDAAKLIHDAKKKTSVVDFNRAGTPLMEIVTEPDLRSPEEAKAFLQELRLIARYLGVSDADMEKGHLRCDANVSVRPVGEKELSPKTEIKNVNSFRSVERALAYEVKRQTALWEEGKPEAEQSTRGWDDARGTTTLLRTKEGSADYRYFPEPDIPELTFSEAYRAKLEAETPELPDARRARFASEYKLPAQDIEVLVNDKALAEFFENVVSELKEWEGSDGKKATVAEMKLAANLLINRLQKALVDAKQGIEESVITAENFAEFVMIVAHKKVNNQAALKVLATMVATGEDPSHIVEEGGHGQIEDEELLNHLVMKVLESNGKVVAEYQAGKHASFQFLVGQVMKEAGGKASPHTVQEVLRKKLSDQ